MEKPSTVLRQEFMENLASLINSSQLPAFVIADILKNTLQVTQEFAEQQYLIDLAKWEEAQKDGNTRSEHENAD